MLTHRVGKAWKLHRVEWSSPCWSVTVHGIWTTGQLTIGPLCSRSRESRVINTTFPSRFKFTTIIRFWREVTCESTSSEAFVYMYCSCEASHHILVVRATNHMGWHISGRTLTKTIADYKGVRTYPSDSIQTCLPSTSCFENEVPWETYFQSNGISHFDPNRSSIEKQRNKVKPFFFNTLIIWNIVESNIRSNRHFP